MDVGQQRRREVQALRRQSELRLPASGAFGDSLLDEAIDAFELHLGDDRANVDRLVQR